MKDAGMRIRVEQELRDAFVAACQKMDVPAAQVLRQHMRVIVEQAGNTPANKQKNVAKAKSK
jgi:antitoxin component of RelBE/YafQ-DinJ toxin-antitoxin module